MGEIQDNGETPIIHTEIETFINNLQGLTGDGVKMGEFAYTSFGDFKDDVLK